MVAGNSDSIWMVLQASTGTDLMLDNMAKRVVSSYTMGVQRTTKQEANSPVQPEGDSVPLMMTMIRLSK